MLFDTFGVDFSKMAPEVSLNDRFYKVFLLTFPGAANTVSLTVFDVLQSRKTHSTFTEKPNAFLILFGSVLQKGLQKSP